MVFGRSVGLEIEVGTEGKVGLFGLVARELGMPVFIVGVTEGTGWLDTDTVGRIVLVAG